MTNAERNIKKHLLCYQVFSNCTEILSRIPPTRSRLVLREMPIIVQTQCGNTFEEN